MDEKSLQEALEALEALVEGYDYDFSEDETEAIETGQEAIKVQMRLLEKVQQLEDECESSVEFEVLGELKSILSGEE